MSYHTEQKAALVTFLSENAQRQFTVRELARAVAERTEIGESTVYRLIAGLVEEGRVRRFAVGRSFYYQFVGGENCDSHLHLKCLACGRLFHLDGSVSQFMRRQILATNRFRLDEGETVLFGTCHDCMGQEGAH